MKKIKLPIFNAIYEQDGFFYIYKLNVSEFKYEQMPNERFKDGISAEQREKELNDEMLEQGQGPLVMVLDDKFVEDM